MYTVSVNVCVLKYDDLLMCIYHSNTDEAFHEMFMRRQISVTISTNGDKHHVLFNRKTAVGRFGEYM